MKLAVLSGKGGAGKTLVAVNLAAAAGRAVYLDCDVEEPNGRLFFRPEDVQTREVVTMLPVFDGEKCSGCRKCVDFCRFHALIYLKGKPKLFSEVCHSCGGCMLVCPSHAVTEEPKVVGQVEQGQHGGVRVVTGILNPGEASGVPVIHQVLKQAGEALTVIDCPPGSACSVMESVTDADYCVLVAEPTAFGFHNFQMVHQLVTLLKKPCGVVVNKQDSPYEPLEAYCKGHGLPILASIPYDPAVARLAAQGEIISERDAAYGERFRSILKQIGGAGQ